MFRPHRRSVCPIVVMVAIAGAGAGCSNSCGNSKKGKASGTLQKAGKTTRAPSKSAVERAFDELVADVVACPWQPRLGVSPRCAGLKKFYRSELLMNEVLLAGLLHDADKRKRWIGATGLRRGRSYRDDAELAKQLVAAMESETDPPTAMAMADAISRIRLAETKLLDRVIKLIRQHPVAAARQRLIKHTLFYNREALYDVVAELAAKGDSIAIRRAAIAALFTGTPEGRRADSCKLWSSLLGDADAKLGAMGAAFATRYGRGVCKRDYDAVLDTVAKRAKAGTVKAEQLTDALRNVYLQPGASTQQKQRARTIARTLLANKSNYGPSRARALELLNRTEKDGAELVKRHLKDKDGFVMRRAERLHRMRAKRRALEKQNKR